MSSHALVVSFLYSFGFFLYGLAWNISSELLTQLSGLRKSPCDRSSEPHLERCHLATDLVNRILKNVSGHFRTSSRDVSATIPLFQSMCVFILLVPFFTFQFVGVYIDMKFRLWDLFVAACTIYIINIKCVLTVRPSFFLKCFKKRRLRYCKY